MTKEKLISSIMCLIITSAAFTQTQKTITPSKPSTPIELGGPSKATATAPAATSALAVGIPNLYSWQIRPNDVDGYFSTDIAQPVCGLVNGTYKIFILTNFDYYPSKNFNNYSNSVRVGEITTLTDSYQLLSNNGSGDPNSLPGKRQEFAVTSILRTGDTNHTIYLFGGKNVSGDLDDVYSYSPGTGFTFVTSIPARNGIAGARSGAVALPAKGNIYLFGGKQANTELSQVLEFDPQINQFTANVMTMPQAFHGARGMTKAVGTTNYIYLVGARTTSNGAPNNLIYRFDAQTGVTKSVMDFNNPSATLTIPIGSGYPMITWDPSGNIRIIAASGMGASGPSTWGNIEAWILTDNYPGLFNDGRAKLTPAPYNNAARARDMAGAVKCGDSTYLIGGTYGHGTTFQNRGILVDRLTGRSSQHKLSVALPGSYHD